MDVRTAGPNTGSVAISAGAIAIGAGSTWNWASAINANAPLSVVNAMPTATALLIASSSGPVTVGAGSVLQGTLRGGNITINSATVQGTVSVHSDVGLSGIMFGGANARLSFPSGQAVPVVRIAANTQFNGVKFGTSVFRVFLCCWRATLSCRVMSSLQFVCVLIARSRSTL